MLRIWLLYNLLLILAILGASLRGITSLAQLLLPLLTLPLLYYLGRELRRKTKVRKVIQSSADSVGAPLAGAREIAQDITPAEEGIPLPGIDDGNRRLFLKLVGSTSLSILFMAVLGKGSAKAAFFGSVPGPGTVAIKDSNGDPIDPAILQPTDGFEISQVDDATTPSYYGFVHKTGAWYITKEDSSGNYRYTKGPSAFSTSWTDRASLTYDYFDAVF